MKKSLNAPGLSVLLASLVLASCAQDVKITAPRYALVYGVSTYQSMYKEAVDYTDGTEPANCINLSYSDDDAKSMADLFTKYGWKVASRIKGSAGDNEFTATTEGPSKANMAQDLKDLAASIDSSATVLLYFSGHGTYDYSTGMPYIVPYEGVSDSATPELDYTKCISPSDLSSMLSVLPTANVIVIFDTCYSGGFASPGSAIDTSPANYSAMPSYSAFSAAFDNFSSLLSANAAASGGKSPIVLSAAGSQEDCYDGTDAQGHGVFTYYLLEAASDGDSDKDGVVTTTEAYVYVSEKVKEWDSAIPILYASYDSSEWPDPFLPHISGGVRDLVLFGP